MCFAISVLVGCVVGMAATLATAWLLDQVWP